MSNGNLLSLDPKLLYAFQAVQRGQEEQVLIERALGKALLTKLQGKNIDLLEVYSGMGGKDPVVQEMMGGELSEAFKAMPVQPGIRVAREKALSERVAGAAAGKNAELTNNPLTQLEGQALNTLTRLGGAEFAAKYKLG